LTCRIILIRHGQPHIALRPRTSHAGFGEYIDAYEEAGLSPANLPPEELRDLVRELDHVFTSGPLFAEAPLASPPIPLLNMRVPKWAVVSRILWHAGFHPEIENPRAAARRAAQAAEILIARAKKSGITALVAHGYFNWMIGRVLLKRGFLRTGSHQARYWNTVIYESKDDRSKS
jgi:broad specificity phosphatase PhoE